MLLVREAADVQHDQRVVAGGEPPPPGVISPARVEEVRIHAASPQFRMREPAADQIVADRLSRREGDPCRAMEPLEPAPYGRLEEPHAVMPAVLGEVGVERSHERQDRKSTRLNSSHVRISYA